MSQYDVESLVEKVRAACLKRGASGIKNLGRAFKIFDDDGSRTLSKYEFAKGMHDYGTGLSPGEADVLFTHFDTDGSGTLHFDEFLIHVRAPMSKSRVELVDKVFDKADRTGDGAITVEDLKGVYSARMHPKYKSGEWSERKVFEDFLKTFQAPGDADETVTRDEFMNYYSGVSASIDKDVYFDFMMRQAWKI